VEKELITKKKGAYGMRSNLAGLSINYNDKFNTRLRAAITHKSPSSHTKKFAERLVKPRDKNRCRKRLYVPNNPRNLIKKRRNENDNEDYGANIHALDIAPEEFKKNCFPQQSSKNRGKSYSIVKGNSGANDFLRKNM
jgi:hypothetical protein